MFYTPSVWIGLALDFFDKILCFDKKMVEMFSNWKKYWFTSNQTIFKAFIPLFASKHRFD